MFLFMVISIWRCGLFETIEGTWTPGDQDLESVQLFFVNNHSELCDSVAFMDSIRSYFSYDEPYGVAFSDQEYWTWGGSGANYYSNEEYAYNYDLGNTELSIYRNPNNKQKIPYQLNGDDLKLKKRKKIKVVVSKSINNFCDLDFDVIYWQNYSK